MNLRTLTIPLLCLATAWLLWRVNDIEHRIATLQTTKQVSYADWYAANPATGWLHVPLAAPQDAIQAAQGGFSSSGGGESAEAAGGASQAIWWCDGDKIKARASELPASCRSWHPFSKWQDQ